MTTLIITVAALGVVCIVLAILYLVVRLRNSALATDLRVTRNQKNNLIGENVHLQDALEKARAQCDVTAQAFTELDSLHQNVVAERNKWEGLYGELVNTLHDAQGDAHATVPLQEVVPAPVKRTTRKKAGAQ